MHKYKAPKYIKQILTDLQRETDINIIIQGNCQDFKQRSSHKTNKEMIDLNYYTLDQWI